MKKNMIRGIGWLFAVVLAALCVPVNAADITEGDYYLVGKDSSKGLTAVDTGKGGIVLGQSMRRANDPGQVWTFAKVGKAGKSTFTIRSKKYGTYLGEGAENDDGDMGVALKKVANASKFSWTLKQNQNSYGLEYGTSGTVLSVSGSSQSDAASIILYESSLGDNLQWFLYPAKERSTMAAPTIPVSSFDNLNKRYRIAPLRPTGPDAERLQRMKLPDYQPSGVYVEKGQRLSITVQGLMPSSEELTIMVGPMNFFVDEGVKNDERRVPQIVAIKDGVTEFVATRSGPIYFRYVDNGFNPVALPILDVAIKGGSSFPLYIEGQTRFDDWRRMLATLSSAPLVEIVSPRVLITATYKVYLKAPQGNPSDILNALERIIGWYDELSGLDGSSELDKPSTLRIHYQQDSVTSSKALTDIYMYASDYFIGIPSDNMGDLLDLKKLRSAWSIWHETGHLYQQENWTSDKNLEVNVNIYSLYAQARLGDPTRLAERDPDTNKSHYDLAIRYMAGDKDDGGGAAFLVMYDQLRIGLPADFYPRLHKYYRAHPVANSTSLDADAKLQIFMLRSSIVSGRDLTKFFTDWRIAINGKTAEQLRALKLPPADRNLSRLGLPR